MSSYLVLSLSFNNISTSGDLSKNFCDYINTSLQKFISDYPFLQSHSYRGESMIDNDNYVSSFMCVLNAVEQSEYEVYLIIDDYDKFATDLLFQIDNSTPDLGLGEYKRAGGAADAYDILNSFGHLVKNHLEMISRSFMTCSTPRYVYPGVHSFVMVLDVCKDRDFEVAVGFTAEEVRQCLSHIYPTQPELVEQHMNTIRTEYDGYRFHSEQVYSVYNSKQVIYYLKALYRTGAPPQPLIDSSITRPDSIATQFIITNYYKHKPIHDKLQLLIGNYNTTILIPRHYYTARLFEHNTVDLTMLLLAYYYGYLTYADPAVGRGLYVVPNAVYTDVIYDVLYSDLGRDLGRGLGGSVNTITAVLEQYKLTRWSGMDSLINITGGIELIKIATDNIFKLQAEEDENAVEGWLGMLKGLCRCGALYNCIRTIAFLTQK